MPTLSIDLQYPAWCATLCALLWIPYIAARNFIWGNPDTFGYPESPPALPGWAQRTRQHHWNMVENLAPLAALVLVANAAGLANETTALRAALFFWARVVHAVVHIAGIPWLRTLAFLAAWVGIVIIFLAIAF